MTEIETIRSAIAAGEIPKADALWSVYAAGVEDEIRNGTFTAARLAETRELVEWARITVMCARSHAQHEVDSLHAALQYDEIVPDDPALFRVHW